MPNSFTTTRRVEFCDTDAAGIAHFSSLFVYMEQAEHEFLRSLGLSVVTRQGDQTISWPRVSAHCDFEGSARFEELVEITVSIVRLGTKSVTYAFQMKTDQRPVAQGTLTSVCCRLDGAGPPKSIPIPAQIVEKLTPFVNEN